MFPFFSSGTVRPCTSRFLLCMFCCMLLMLHACSLFETRTPEEPDTSSSDYRPATSYDNVIHNFQFAVLHKNVYYFTTSLAGGQSAASDSLLYVFEPSAEASVRFADRFNEWDVEKETIAFNSLAARVTQPLMPVKFSAGHYEAIHSDSVTYAFDYIFTFADTKDSSVYAGSSRLTVSRSGNGLWAISRWIDIATQPGPADNTWSVLKAQP